MQIFDFITEDEISELPEDDDAAFLSFVKIARKRLASATEGLDPRDEGEWERLNEARHGFVNVVTAAARRYGIEPFASMDVPRLANFAHEEHRQFTADLDHYMTQLLLSDGFGVKRDSVALSENAKARIRTHLHHLRDQLNRESMPDDKRQRLMKKLDEFEEALEKRRLSLLAVTRITVEILAAPGALAGSYDIATKLLSNVMQTVAEEKGQEEEKKPVLEKVRAILPARRFEERKIEKSDRNADDDIPF